MQGGQIAELVEFSEARAYAGLMLAAGHIGHATTSPLVRQIGSAIAIAHPEVATSLNLNRVIGLGVREPADETMLDSIASVYGDFGLSYGIEIGPLVRPREVSAWLRLRRMRRIMPTSIRYRAAAPIRRESGEPSVDRAISVDEIATAARISCSVFRMPAAVETLLANTRHDPRWRMWIARSGETPIAAAMSFMDQGVAWLGWDATLPAFRGHGAHNALIAARVADAYDHDCHHVTAETAVHTSARPDPSGRNYERLGFLLAYDRLTYVFIGTRAASSAFRQ